MSTPDQDPHFHNRNAYIYWAGIGQLAIGVAAGYALATGSIQIHNTNNQITKVESQYPVATSKVVELTRQRQDQADLFTAALMGLIASGSIAAATTRWTKLGFDYYPLEETDLQPPPRAVVAAPTI